MHERLLEDAHLSAADPLLATKPDHRKGLTPEFAVQTALKLDEGAVIIHVKGKLAAYKAPKRVLAIDTIGRAPNGKVDYKRLKGWAAEQLGVPS